MYFEVWSAICSLKVLVSWIYRMICGQSPVMPNFCREEFFYMNLHNFFPSNSDSFSQKSTPFAAIIKSLHIFFFVWVFVYTVAYTLFVHMYDYLSVCLYVWKEEKMVVNGEKLRHSFQLHFSSLISSYFC